MAAITSNLKLAVPPRNVLCRKRDTHLRKDSVVNASQVGTLDQGFVIERVGHLPSRMFHQVEDGLRLVLGL